MKKAMKLIQLWAVVLLALHLTAARNAGAQSLWGLKAILQRSDCQYWMLNPDHSLPALEEFSICVNVQRSINNSAWTAFTYVHPDQSRVELGLGGRGGKLHIWLFGMYRTVPDTLTVGQWCSICITWSCSTKQLQLFINGSNAVVMDVQPEDSTCGLSAGGSLTLGAAHYFTGGMMEVESGTNLQGNITLFRVWRKIRSPELHSAHSCTDGDALRWHGRVWNAHSCPAEKDDTLTCAWSLYEVQVRLFILHCSRNINSYEAREITHHWLRCVLPSNIYLHRVLASPVSRSAGSHRKTGDDKGNLRKNPHVRWFDALAHLTVIPSDDVGKVQDLVYERLSNEFYTDNYHVYPIKELLHIYSIDGDEVPKSTSKPINSTPNPTDTNTKPSITTILGTTLTHSTPLTPGTTTTPIKTTILGTISTPSTTLIPGTTTIPITTTILGTTSTPSTPLTPATTTTPSTTIILGTTSTTSRPLTPATTTTPSTTTILGTTSTPSTTTTPITTTILGTTSTPGTPLTPATTTTPSTTTILGTTSTPSTTTTPDTSITPSTTTTPITTTILGTTTTPSTTTILGTTSTPSTTLIPGTTTTPITTTILGTTSTPSTTTTPDTTISGTTTTPNTTISTITTTRPSLTTTSSTITTPVATTNPTISTTLGTTTAPGTTTTLNTITTPGTTPIKTTILGTTSTPSTTTTSSTTEPSVSPVFPPATDSFFKVSVNVTIEESEVDPADTIQTWLYGTLSANGISVLNFHFISPQTRTVRLKKRSNQVKEALVFTEESHSCMFQMLVPKCSDVEETQRQIHDLLEKPYSNGSMRLDADPENIFISHIEPGLCPQLTQQTRQGRYVWPWTPAQRTAWQHCEADKDCLAFRQCLLSADTSQAAWVSPELQRCPTVVATISDLEQIEVTRDTAEDVLQMIVDILKEHDSLDKCDLQTVLNKLQEVLNITTVTRDLAEVIVSIMSNILNSKSDLQPFTNDILNITDTVGVELSNFIGESVTVVAPGLALSVVTVDPENTNNLTFGVTSVNDGPYPTIYINKDPYEGTVAFISLPSALHASFPPRNSTNPRVQFQFYGVPALFKDGESGQSLNTYVVSASVINVAEPVENLKEPVIVTLHHLDTQITGKEVHCVYWDFNKNGGCGGWSLRGCWKHNGTLEYTTCMCDHLTHFGVLLDVSRTPIDEENEKILTVISYVGCGLSSFFLGVTVLTYSLLDKLRRDYPSQILLNLSIALLGLNLVFLTNSWFSAFAVYGLCVAVAAAQHYFLLASFSWMLLEAVNMYFALVKVFNVYVPSYILKFCIVGWGAPLVICCLVLVVKQEAYAVASFTDQDTLEDSEMFCWIQDDVVFFVSVVGFIGLVLLCNFSIFLVVLLQMKKMRVNQPAGTHRSLLKDLRGVASFTLLLGLTWAVAFFTWGPAKVPLLYLFSILNSLQGSFIFIFHCLMKENVRKQWRIHLCFGRFKLQDQSDWSHTATVIAKPKRSRFPKFPTVASFRSSKSNSTQSSSLSSDSSQRQDSIRRPNLDVMYQQSLVLPRIRLTPSAPPSANANGDLPEAEGYEVRSWIPAERSSSVHCN